VRQTTLNLLASCLLVTAVAQSPVWAQDDELDVQRPSEPQINISTCSGTTDCYNKNHHAGATGSYPYNEDFTVASTVDHPNLPCSAGTDQFGQLTLPGQYCGIPCTTDNYCTIDYKCVNATGNLNFTGTAPFNATLRGYFQVNGATAAEGTPYNVRLLVDGNDYGTYRKVLRGNYPYGEPFEGSAQNLPAGNHTFSLQVQLLTGQMTIQYPWMTAQGAPASFPSKKAQLSTAQTLTTAYSIISDPANKMTFTRLYRPTSHCKAILK
jgi:hypothetical protein